MYFNVSQLMRESSGSARTYEVDESVLLHSTGERCRVVGKVSLLKTDGGMWVDALLDTELSCNCSRCLLDLKQPIHMKIEEEFLPETDVFTGARLHKPSDFDENFYVDQNHVLDLTEAVNQYVDMNTPMKPMCSKDCAGICMTCGVNLNESSCMCDKALRDPRWDTLVELVATNVNDS